MPGRGHNDVLELGVAGFLTILFLTPALALTGLLSPRAALMLPMAISIGPMFVIILLRLKWEDAGADYVQEYAVWMALLSFVFAALCTMFGLGRWVLASGNG
ncbi:MAG: hypothetical protein H6819_11560 [Phycisphaerales bacterium]|nr:hypothetical protein [Phycisphaerales bacterium]MCB9856793.1 hypothetical protein [Phycisphaerales bacterium]MCB9862080.1 hypothetical protein [Phycisphaerales bacterium]